MRRLGRSDIEVSRVVFGAWAIGGWYWGGTDDRAAEDAIRAAIDHGINAIDTAPVYGRGHSEEVVGRAIRGRRDRVVVMTKVGLRWDDDRGAHFFDATEPDGTTFRLYRNLRPDSIRHEVEQSLRRLGVDVIDVLQCHWPDPTTPVEETMEALVRLVEEGKVRAIGVSNFDVDLLERALRAVEGDPPHGRTGGFVLASDQPPYSLLRRGIERDVLPWCRRHEVGIVAYSPMERGLLTGKCGPDRVFPESDGRSHDWMFTVENRRRVAEAIERTAPIREELGCTMAQLALAWIFHQPGVTAAIAGARNPRQAEENAAAMRLELTPEQLREVGAIFEAVELER